jgi:methyl-accepting chemotaxis protein
MKRKIFQIVLMGAVTVSLGMFVSCKDTSADLSKQLEWQQLQIDSKTSLEEVIEMQKQQMEELKKYIQDQLATIKQCNCPENLSQTISELTNFMNNMKEAGVESENSLETLKGLLEGITNNYSTIENFFNNVGVSEAELQAAVDKLEDEIAKIQKCQCDLSKYATLELVNEIQQTANQAKQLAEQANEKIATALEMADAAKTIAEQAKTAAETAAGKADAAKELADSLKVIAEAADKLSKENATKIAENSEAISKIDVKLIAMSDSLKHAYETADKAWTQAFENKTAIELMDVTVQANKTAIEALQEATKGIPALETSVNTLTHKVDSLCTEVTDLKEEITKLYAYADANLEKAKAYTDLEIALVRADIAGINVDIQQLREDLEGEIDDLWEEIQKLKEKDEEFSEKFEEYKNTTDEKITNALNDIVNLKNSVETINDSLKILDDKIEENTIKIGEVETALQDAMAEFQDKIDDLQSQIDDLGDAVEENTSKIKKLTGAFELLQANLKKQVTGIIVQQTYNPAFGTVNLPFGVQSNVLMAYYGEANQDVYFPTARTANYVDEKYALTAKDMQMLELDDTPIFNAGDTIMQNEEKNAGTLYLTVNPNTVDFKGLQLSLVNSQEKESYVKLGELKPSDKTLELGFSRAADNGFYECSATVSPDDVNKVQKVNLNLSTIKNDIEEIMNKRSAADFKGIAADMVDVIKGLKLDANAVKCEWEDEVEEGAEPQKHAVYSNYNLAATAVKPLSLQTAKDFNYKTIPGYEKAMALLDSVSATLHGAVRTAYKELNGSNLVEHVSNLKINKVTIADLTADQLALFKVSIDTTIYIDGLKYYLDLNQTVDVPVKFETDVTVPVNIDQDVAIDLSKVTVNSPTIVVTTNIKNKDGSATLVVPVIPEGGGDAIGNATVDLEQIDVKADATLGTITLNGTTVAHLTYKDDVTAHISVDETVAATVNIQKLIYFGECKLAKDAEGNILKDKNGKPIVYVDGEGKNDAKGVNIFVTKDLSNAAQSLWGSAQSAIGSVNDMLDDLNQIVGDANDLIAKINSYEEKINTKIDDYMDKVASYIKKFNKVIVDFVNNTNARLQPTLVASDAKGTKILSRAKSYPTLMKAGVINLVPTTWTLELVVPLAKKHVAVTNVFKDNKSAQGGDNNCKSELKRVNGGENMNTVIAGDIRRVYADMKSGYTYEVAYSALDFHGKIATRKYYITIE